MFRLFEDKINQFIGLIDNGLRTMSGDYGEASEFEGVEHQPQLTDDERKQSGDLIRVNHVGEICAQALYLGQAFTARSEEARHKLLRAADEERAHLSWCEQRLDELEGSTSVLGPLFYVASASLGLVTGMLGDRISLGFVEATEDQVVAHLDRHLAELPSPDVRSKEILIAIRDDELAHGERALDAGGVKYPDAIRRFMTLASKVMTETTKHV